MQLVKVKYSKDGSYSGREYTYYSEDDLDIGDIVNVPVRDTTGKAMISAIDVPENEIEKFRDKVKIIPAGSVVKEDDEPLNQMPGFFLPGAEVIKEDKPTIEGKTAIITIEPETNAAVISLTAEVNKLRDYALSRVVTSDLELTPLTNDLTLIAKVKKSITDYKEVYIRPIKNHLDSVSGVFNRLLDVLKEADTVNRSKFTAFKAAQEKRARDIEETNRQAQEIAQKQATLNQGEFTVDTTPIAVPEPVQKVSTLSGTAST
jgi:hypothetical protein